MSSQSNVVCLLRGEMSSACWEWGKEQIYWQADDPIVTWSIMLDVGGCLPDSDSLSIMSWAYEVMSWGYEPRCCSIQHVLLLSSCCENVIAIANFFSLTEILRCSSTQYQYKLEYVVLCMYTCSFLSIYVWFLSLHLYIWEYVWSTCNHAQTWSWKKRENNFLYQL